MKKQLNNLFIIVLIICFFNINLVRAPQLRGALLTNKFKVIDTQIKIQELENSKFSKKNLIKYLELLEIDNKDIVLKQAILETGWFNSSLFKEGNNLFGMKVPKIRESVANGSYLSHAKYSHWTDSVKDYILWLEHWKSKGKDTTNYYVFLDSIGYAIDSKYINILHRVNLSRLYL